MLILLTFHFSVNQGSVQRSTEGDRRIAFFMLQIGISAIVLFFPQLRGDLAEKNSQITKKQVWIAKNCLTKIITKNHLKRSTFLTKFFWTIGLLWSNLILTFVFGGRGHGSQLVLSCWNQDASKMVTILSWPMWGRVIFMKYVEYCTMITFLLMRFFSFGILQFYSILSTMVIFSCPVFVSLVFESIGIRQFSTCFQNIFCTLNLVNSSFNMLFGLVASLFDPPRWHGFVKVSQKWKAMAQAKGLGGMWDKSLEMSWHVKITLHLDFFPTNLPPVRIWRFGTPTNGRK